MLINNQNKALISYIKIIENNIFDIKLKEHGGMERIAAAIRGIMENIKSELTKENLEMITNLVINNIDKKERCRDVLIEIFANTVFNIEGWLTKENLEMITNLIINSTKDEENKEIRKEILKEVFKEVFIEAVNKARTARTVEELEMIISALESSINDGKIFEEELKEVFIEAVDKARTVEELEIIINLAKKKI